MKNTIRYFVALLSFYFLLPLIVSAQQGYWIMLRDKKPDPFDPHQFFDPKAIERRERNHIPINDASDWPVTETYLAQVASLSDTVLFASRWFNAIAVYAGETTIQQIAELPFVAEVVASGPEEPHARVCVYDTSLSDLDQDILERQLTSMQGEWFSEAGIDGKGVRIAIFDVGFPGADINPAFEHIRNEGRLIATKDFTRNKKTVFWGKSHGTHVWSCIAGRVGDRKTGLATGAEFLLAKTELNSERFVEEVNWMQAAEWADQHGADIISSSLGYTRQRYFPWDMDGRKSFVSRAANMAARKGILVVNAAGNDGNGNWRTLGAPADADSVLTIGGIDPLTGYHISFSSFGPTADKRRKPNVCAFGSVIVSDNSGFKNAQGTSFATPLVSGFAACALQLNKNLSNMELFRKLEESGNLYPYFDYAHGYGIPQASFFFNPSAVEPTFEFTVSDDTLYIDVSEAILNNQKYMDRFLLYYNIENNRGILDSYYLLSVDKPRALTLPLAAFPEDKIINVHYAGYTASFSPTKQQQP